MKIGVAKKAPGMYMRECEHRAYEVEIGDGGGITRKSRAWAGRAA